MRGAVSPQDQISELNKKLQLHEGDLKAYIEVYFTYFTIYLNMIDYCLVF